MTDWEPIPDNQGWVAFEDESSNGANQWIKKCKFASLEVRLIGHELKLYLLVLGKTTEYVQKDPIVLEQLPEAKRMLELMYAEEIMAETSAVLNK